MQKNGIVINFCVQDLKKYIGVLIFMSLIIHSVI